MDENHYRHTYQQINGQRCVFEKSILTRLSSCSQSHRFCLADREGIACSNTHAHQRCTALLERLRRNANFSLGMSKVETALPHNKEIRIQNGGLLGIQKVVSNNACSEQTIADINDLITQTIETFHSIDALPYDEVVKSIVSYEVKKRRRPG